MRFLKLIGISLISICLSVGCFSFLADAYEPITIFQFEMKSGWNLISIPVVPLDAKASVVFPQTAVKELAYWNPATESYVMIKSGGTWSNEGYCIQVGDAYWIYTESNITISIYGVTAQFPFTVRIRTRAGESHADNFGVPVTNTTRWDEVSTYNLDIISISYFDADVQNWVRYYQSNLSSLVFEPARGYAIRTWQPGTIMFYSYMIAPEYAQLRSDYNNLLSNYSSLQSSYASLQADYSDLQALYSSLSSNYSSLSSSYSDLQTMYQTYNSNYSSLLSNYNNLQASFVGLNQTHNELINEHSDLLSQQKSTLNELDMTRYLVYVLVATAIVLTATTVYFAKRKRKA